MLISSWGLAFLVLLSSTFGAFGTSDIQEKCKYVYFALDLASKQLAARKWCTGGASKPLGACKCYAIAASEVLGRASPESLSARKLRPGFSALLM